MISLPPIDGRAIQQRLQELSRYSVLEDRLWRPSYTPQEAQVRRQLSSWFTQAGLQPRTDAVGNLHGRLEGTGKTVLVGSHMDTVKDAGAYDGCAGVLCGLAAIQALLEQYGPPKAPVELISMVEEEGSRFSDASFWGSRAVTGQIHQEMLSCRDEEEITLAQAMEEMGFEPAGIDTARRDDLACYLEMHIEQGPILEHRGVQIGIVDSITGIGIIRVDITGRANHAGTTPMDLRLDALQGAAKLVLQLPELARRFPGSTVTPGFFQVFPGSANVVPGQVSMLIDYRAARQEDLEQLGQLINQAAHELEADGFSLSTHFRDPILPAPLDPGLGRLQEQCARELGYSTMHMISGAGHDCQFFARQIPSALLFIPCRDGRSHCPQEYASPEDLSRGAQVLAGTLYRLAWED